MRNILITGSFVVAAVLWAAPAGAHAAAPTIYRDTGSGSFVDSSTCADPLGVDYDNDEVVHEFTDANGQLTSVRYTGPVHLTYTNFTTGVAYSPNSFGPGVYDVSTGVLTLTGSNGAVWDPDGILVAHQGRLVYDADAAIVSWVGHSAGVCEAVGSTPA